MFRAGDSMMLREAGVSSWSGKGDLPEEATVELSPAWLWGENSPGRGSHECKGPGAGRGPT